MQPRPMAETSKLLFPSFRFCIVSHPFHKAMHAMICGSLFSNAPFKRQCRNTDRPIWRRAVSPTVVLPEDQSRSWWRFGFCRARPYTFPEALRSRFATRRQQVRTSLESNSNRPWWNSQKWADARLLLYPCRWS